MKRLITMLSIVMVSLIAINNLCITWTSPLCGGREVTVDAIEQLGETLFRGFDDKNPVATYLNEAPHLRLLNILRNLMYFVY